MTPAPTDKGAATPDALLPIVNEAMQDAWNEICADGHHPTDITHSRGKRLEFRPGQWARHVAELLAVRLRASAPPQPCAPVTRTACEDLDPNWPGDNGEPRGPRLCLLYPNCSCGRKDAPSPTAGHAVESVDDMEEAAQVLEEYAQNDEREHERGGALIGAPKAAKRLAASLRAALAERLGREVEPVAWRRSAVAAKAASLWMVYEEDDAYRQALEDHGVAIEYAWSGPPPASVKPEWRAPTIEDAARLRQAMYDREFTNTSAVRSRDDCMLAALNAINARIAGKPAAVGQEKAG